ncbi:P-loop NTPase fold protein [Bacillus cereus]|nr:P-loop NTPase fold protein [Bacillus cereus]MEB9555130.1 P-loop NTPase fold protein [Bacillus cereus]
MSQSQYIVDSIKGFIKQEQTSYAVLINGAWGSGKTHFWENNLIEEIEEIPIIQDNSDDTYKHVYISLYGLSSVDEVRKKLLLNLYLYKNKGENKNKFKLFNNKFNPFKNEKVIKVGSIVLSGLKDAKFFGVSAKSFELETTDIQKLINLSDVVFCFDDLERSSIPINELLGYINELVEHGNAKVIIIANEEAIEEKEKYKKIKEKVVGRTLLYKPDHTVVVEQIVNSMKNQDCKKMLQDNMVIIEKIFHSSNTNNIRILKQIIFDFEIIYNEVKENYPKISEKVMREILYFTLAISFEIRSGMKESDSLEKIKSDKEFFYHVRLKDNVKDEPWKSLKAFDEKYLLEENNIRYIKFIETFVRKGILDIETFKNEMDGITKNGDEELKYNSFITHEYWYHSDQDFRRLTQLTFEKLEQGDCGLYTYYIAYKRFEELIKLKLFDKSIDELTEAILSGIDKAKEKAEYEEGREEGLSDARTMASGNRKLILDKLCSSIDELKAQKEKQDIFNLFQLIKVDVPRFGGELDVEYQDIPIFHILELQLIKETIFSLENRDLYFFIDVMERRYKDGMREELSVELPVLKELKKEIEYHIKGKEISPKVILLKELAECISEITK